MTKVFENVSNKERINLIYVFQFQTNVFEVKPSIFYLIL